MSAILVGQIWPKDIDLPREIMSLVPDKKIKVIKIYQINMTIQSLVTPLLQPSLCVRMSARRPNNCFTDQQI